jgi:hypothetical protein
MDSNQSVIQVIKIFEARAAKKILELQRLSYRVKLCAMLKPSLSRIVLIGFSALTLIGCVPNQAASVRTLHSGIPMLESEVWTLEIRNNKTGDLSKAKYQLKGGIQKPATEPDGSNSIRSGQFVLKAPKLPPEMEFAEISFGQVTGLVIYFKQSNGKNSLDVIPDTSKIITDPKNRLVGQPLGGCSFIGWQDSATEFSGVFVDNLIVDATGTCQLKLNLQPNA